MLTIFLRFLRKTGLIDYFNLYPSKKIQGRKIVIPIIQGIGLNNYLKLSEYWMTFIISRLIEMKKDGAFIDIGANIGQTLIKTKLANPDYQYVGFEPNPSCNHYLGLLIEKNSFKKTQVLPIGVSNQSKVLELNLFSSEAADTTATILSDFRDQSSIKKTLNIPVFEIGQINERIPKMSIVKIDVEGAELEVIESLKGRIKSDKPIVLIEILPVYNSENEKRLSRQKGIETILNDLDYSILRVSKNNEKFEGVVELKEFGIHSNLEECDYILCPKNEVEIIHLALKR